MATSRYDILDRYGRNLTALAKKGKLDPCIGRDEELNRCVQILSRKRKNNPVLIGSPGVGKSTIVSGLARRIVDNDVPEALRGKVIYTVDFSVVLAGASVKGQFEERLQEIIKTVVDSSGQIILFIDEIHNIAKAGGGGGALAASNILKPALARGDLCCIGATTLDEYRDSIEKDPALERRFQSVLVEEPSPEEAITILRGLRSTYEISHGVQILDESLTAAVRLADRYVKDRFLPDKAIDLLDEACSALRMELDSMPREIDQAVRKLNKLRKERAAMPNRHDAAEIDRNINETMTRLDNMLAQLTKEREQLQTIQNLKKEVETLTTLSDRYSTEGDLSTACEVRYGKLFSTQKKLDEETAKLAAMHETAHFLREEVCENDIAHVISKWTGIPAGKMLTSEKEKLRNMEATLKEVVIGQDHAVTAVTQAIKRSRTGISSPDKPVGTFFFLGSSGTGKTELSKALATFLFDDPKAIIRIDMSEYMEKSAVARLIGAPPGYVGYEAGGQLTEKVRRKPYSVVLFDEVEKAHPEVMNVMLQLLDEGRLTDGQGKLIDFRQTVVILTSNLPQEQLKSYFRPEFLNRLDEVVKFNSITPEVLQKIVKIQVKQLTSRMSTQGIGIDVSDEACSYLAHEGYDEEYGARPLKRCFQRLLENPICEKCLEGTLLPGDTLSVSLTNGELTLTAGTLRSP